MSQKRGSRSSPRQPGQSQEPERRRRKLVWPMEAWNKPGRVVVAAADGTPYDAHFVFTDVKKNVNKCLSIQIIRDHAGDYAEVKNDYQVVQSSGRVGGTRHLSTHGPFTLKEALVEFNATCRAKSGLEFDSLHQPPIEGMYTFVRNKYEEESEEEYADQDIWYYPSLRKVPREPNKFSNIKSEYAPTLPRSHKELLELIFNEKFLVSALDDMGMDRASLPLGRLEQKVFERAYDSLSKAEHLIENGDCHCSTCKNPTDGDWIMSSKDSLYTKFTNLSNRYYRTIPHAISRNKPPRINTKEIVEAQIKKLRELEEMDATMKINAATKRKDLEEQSRLRLKALNLVELTTLDPGGQEYSCLKRYLVKTSFHAHGLRFCVERIFRVERAGEADRFREWSRSVLPKKKTSSRRCLLWHGSRVANVAGILSQGLCVSPASAGRNGAAFGRGIYFADVSSKSGNYCYAEGGEQSAILFLCEVEIGKVTHDEWYGSRETEANVNAKGLVAAKGDGAWQPCEWIDAGFINPNLEHILVPNFNHPGSGPLVHLSTPRDANRITYNEYIVFDEAQVRVRYVIRARIYPK